MSRLNLPVVSILYAMGGTEKTCFCYACGKNRTMAMVPIPDRPGRFVGHCPDCGRERPWASKREYRTYAENQARLAYQSEARRETESRQREYAALVAQGEAPPISMWAKVSCFRCPFKGKVEFTGPRSDQPLDGNCPRCTVRLQWDPVLRIQRYVSPDNEAALPIPELTARDKVRRGAEAGLEFSLSAIYVIVIGIGVVLGGALLLGMLLSGGGGGDEGCTEYGGPASGQC